jgi:hypothetical protein
VKGEIGFDVEEAHGGILFNVDRKKLYYFSRQEEWHRSRINNRSPLTFQLIITRVALIRKEMRWSRPVSSTTNTSTNTSTNKPLKMPQHFAIG